VSSTPSLGKVTTDMNSCGHLEGIFMYDRKEIDLEKYLVF
jgi:hypothetical protein